jgi:hypothetical protein
LKQLLKKHLINLRGKNVNDKIVIIESDDWGSIRIPNQNCQNHLVSGGLIDLKNNFSAFDCLESGSDLLALYAVLGQHKDRLGNSPIFTANMVMQNPDFDKIQNNHFNKFYSEPFFETYRSYYPEEKTFDKLMQGIETGVIFPQFHADVHLNFIKWLKLLQNNDQRFMTAFQMRCFAIDDVGTDNLRNNLMATYDYFSSDELDVIRESIDTGLTIFKDTFGFNSRTTIAPCYVWNAHIEKKFKEHNVEAFQSSYVQKFNIPEKSKHKNIWKIGGNQNQNGQLNFVRNVLFEPSVKGVNWVDKSLESVKIAFAWKKPAILSTHRVNYVSGLSISNRENSLDQLNNLLLEILRRYPEVIFLSSPQLIDYYNGK